MTDQGVSKEVPQQLFLTINTLKEVADLAKKYLRRTKKRQLKIRAKVNNVQNNAGQLVDSTGLINFVLEGATVSAGQTYDLTGSLTVVNYKLTINVTSATVSAEAITETGAEQFSAAQIDANSGKPITNISTLLTSRIGQSFYAKPLNVVVDQKKAKATLADQNGAIDVEINTNRTITVELLNSLSSDKVYLFSDMVINFTQDNNLVGRFNYRSGIFEVNDHTINQISNNNLSAKKYTEDEKKELTTVLQIREKKDSPKSHKKNNNKRQQRKNNNSQNNNNGENKTQKRTIDATAPVTIAELQQWNNNQSFQGKILTLNVESKTLKAREGEQPAVRNYLKGTVGDHTGVIDFDMAEKNGQPVFKVGDYVKFSKVMNKGRHTVNGETKTGGHYIEVKKYGQYEIVNDAVNSDYQIDTENNLSAKELTNRPKSEKPHNNNNKKRNNSGENKNNNRGDKGHRNNNRSSTPNQQQNNNSRNNRNNSNDGHQNNNRNRNNNNNEDNQNNNRRNNSNNREQNNDNRRNNSNQRQNNNNNNNNNNSRVNNNNRNNNRSHSTNNNNNNYNNNNNRGNNSRGNSNNYNNNNNRSHNNNHSHSAPRPQKRNLVDILNLRPGERNIDFVGYVYEVKEFSKEINDKTLFFLRGRVADAQANIKFDIKKPRNVQIEEGKTYLFSNVINKVSNEGFHFVDVHRFGKIVLAQEPIKNPNTSNVNDADRSAIEYIKKTVEN